MVRRLSDYDVQFDKMFTVPEATKLFSWYLQQGKNEDSFNFALDVRKLKTIEDPEKQIQLILHIVDTYIVDRASCEINIEMAEKRPLLRLINESRQREKRELVVPLNLFDSVLAIALRELKDDAFGRFCWSRCLEDYVQKSKDDSFLMSIGKRKIPRVDDLKIEQEDFYHFAITDAEIKKIFNIVEDVAEWRGIQSKKEKPCYAYIRSIKNSDGNSMFIAKACGKLNYCAEHVLDALLHSDRRKEWDHEAVTHTYHGYTPPTQDTYGQNTTLFFIDMPFYLQNRASLLTGTLLFDNVRQCYFWIEKTVLPATHPAIKEKVDAGAVHSEAWFLIQVVKVSDTSCRYIHTGIIDNHMQMNSEFVFKKITKSHLKKMHNSIDKLCVSIKDTWYKERAKNHHGLYDALDDFVTRYPNGKTWTQDEIKND
jgi:hypothetical protein